MFVTFPRNWTDSKFLHVENKKQLKTVTFLGIINDVKPFTEKALSPIVSTLSGREIDCKRGQL